MDTVMEEEVGHWSNGLGDGRLFLSINLFQITVTATIMATAMEGRGREEVRSCRL